MPNDCLPVPAFRISLAERAALIRRRFSSLVGAGFGLLVTCSLGVSIAAPAQAAPLPLDPAREAAVSARFAQLRGSPPELRLFLRGMPKGGDLHNHLGGGAYAEDFIRWGAALGYCADAAGRAITPPPCDKGRPLAELGGADDPAYDQLVDALSVRGWRQGVGAGAISGHDQFFGTFARFEAIGARSAGPMLASARTIAAADNLSYLELDHNPGAFSAAIMAAPDGALAETDLPARHAADVQVLAPLVAAARAQLDAEDAAVARELGCATAAPEPGCAVAVRYLFQGLRALPPGKVFRSLLAGFLLAKADPRYVGINLVMPEDALAARRDYRLHMAMVRYLARQYPGVKISLHAGELAPALVPPADLRDHIAQAIGAGAQRIGHGTAIAYEDAAEATMARMAREGIAVEINLTSNAVILGVSGADHPLALYRSRGVPVVLSTDDQGVLRTDMTAEYVRAVREQGLGYGELKQIARAGIHSSFAPGASLWADPVALVPVAACRDLAAAGCTAFLAANEKARLEADLEQRFARFESARLAPAGALQ